jgi:hypothetical protein
VAVNQINRIWLCSELGDKAVGGICPVHNTQDCLEVYIRLPVLVEYFKSQLDSMEQRIRRSTN